MTGIMVSAGAPLESGIGRYYQNLWSIRHFCHYSSTSEAEWRRDFVMLGPHSGPYGFFSRPAQRALLVLAEVVTDDGVAEADD